MILDIEFSRTEGGRTVTTFFLGGGGEGWLNTIAPLVLLKVKKFSKNQP